MSTAPTNGYFGITPEELQVLTRRAHAERAKVMRDMFAALFSWLRRVAPQRASRAALTVAPCA
jgi:L-serine deaminase